jgi:hypothetical protein
VNRTLFHRRRLAIALAISGVVALAACVEAPPTAADGPAEGVGMSIVPVTSQQVALTLGEGLFPVIGVRVLGSSGAPVRSAIVHYSVVSGNGVFSADSTLTNDQGYTQVLFAPLSTGTILVQARSGDDMVTFAFEVASDPNLATSFQKTGGDTQTAVVGAILPQPLSVQVRNPDGLPVDSIAVTFSVQIAQGDSAKLSADPSDFRAGGRLVTVRTDAAGFARVWLRLGTLAGSHVVSATALVGPAGAQTAQTLTFSANALPSPRASQLIIISGDDQTVPIDTLFAGGPLDRTRDPNPLVVQALDAFGTPVSGVAVQWRVSDGGGVMFSFTTFTDMFGFATNFYSGATEGSNAVVAIAPGTAPVTFNIEGVVIVDPEEEGDGGGGGGGGGGG